METKKVSMPVSMPKTLDTKVNKILIWTPGIAEKSIEEPREISKIMRLLQGKAEKCEYFVDSPQLMSFRIELYNNQKLLERIPVAGDFIERADDEWYYMQGLGKKLYRIYEKYLFD